GSQASRTRSTNFWISSMLRIGLTTPPSHRREGTAIAMATQDRPPCRLAYSSSAWTWPRSTFLVRRWWLCTAWQCSPALAWQEATVRSSREKAATTAGRGHPWASRVMTQTNKVWSLCKRYKGVPRVAAKVLLQVAQRKRLSVLECTLTLPLTMAPLSVQSGLAQNTPWGFMAGFRRVRW